jgi:cytochrome c biogenesis protein CcmG/thiol:disulfide interchange protein DsbE
MRVAGFAVLLLCFFPSAVSQSTVEASTDGYELLQRVAQHYANAKSYHLRATWEYVSWNKLQRNWDKNIWDVAEAPGNRYRYEGESGTGHALRVSDGKDVWTYHVEEAAYKRASLSELSSATHTGIPPTELALSSASRLREGLASLAKTYKSAARLHDSEITIEGKRIFCYVLQLKTSDERRKRADESSERTLWVDKSNETIVKDAVKVHASEYSGGARIPSDGEGNTTYWLRELDSPLSDALFTFVPPVNAKLVRRFSSDASIGASLEGKPLPALKLTTLEGTEFPTTSRGKPILIDIWASWCVPCLQELDSLGAIYAGLKGNMAVITIDQDEDAKDASNVIRKKKYSWPNFHDDGDIANALGGTNGIPRTIIADANRQVIYDKTGFDQEDLWHAISSLGPEYAALISRGPPPCAPGSATK